jgi:ribosomal protein S25
LRKSSIFLSKTDRIRREKLRRKREEEEQQQQTVKDDSSRIVEVTDEEAEKITKENAQAKVMITIRKHRRLSRRFLGSKIGCRKSNILCNRRKSRSI